MNPIIPHADPLPLPGPEGLFWFLLMLTFTLHVVAMNLLLGGSVIGAVSRFRSRGGLSHEAELSRIVGKSLPVLTAATVTLGVAALLFVQVLFGRLFFSSAVLMAWYWFAVVPVLIVAYYAAYAVAFRTGAGAARGLSLLTAILLLGIAFVYASNMTLMTRPELFRELYARGGAGFQLGPITGLLVVRFLHMVTGAIAVAGAGVCLLGWIVTRRANSLRRPALSGPAEAVLAGPADAGSEPALEAHAATAEFGRWAMARGAAWFVGATTLNVLWGVWYLGSLPTATILALIGGNPVAAAIFGAGILLGLVALGAIFAAAKSEKADMPLGVGVGALVLTLVAMLLTRDFVRQTALDVAGFAPQTWIQPQWGPIAIFVGLLVAALAAVGWMVAVFVKAGRAAHSASVRT